MALAGLIPFEYLAGADALVYTRIRALQRHDGVPPEPVVIDEIRCQARRLAVSRWIMDLRTYSSKCSPGTAASETTAACHHCREALDTAQHALEVCPAFSALRRVLIQEVGYDLSLPALVGASLASERSWKAVASFCEQVMLQKEATERVREEADPQRRRRGRSRRDAAAPSRPPAVVRGSSRGRRGPRLDSSACRLQADGPSV
ncbi:uncharacterized protein LOC143264776 [Megachile rotundata]|uniref:uncharacterized protein LOC143264776 n=1 Tax=Megachile rotundata TaxID=143995 RepID=UPI003FD3E5E9